MAGFLAFQPNLGETQSIAIGSGSATSQSVSFNLTGETPSLQATFTGATAGTVAYLRIQADSSATATTSDAPIVAQGTTPTIQLYAAPSGQFSVAVIVSATPSTAGTMYLCPGQGGI